MIWKRALVCSIMGSLYGARSLELVTKSDSAVMARDVIFSHLYHKATSKCLCLY